MSTKRPVRFILGTHMIGDVTAMPGVIHFDTPESVRELLATFHARGYTELDTARNYVGSEQRLGAAKAPSQFTVHTKVNSGTPGDHEPAKIALSVEQSLENLKVPLVQTMFLHVPDRQTSYEETVRAMHEVRQQGKCKEWGLSNYTAAEVAQILAICERRGYSKPSVFQGHYNAIVRGGEEDLFPLLRKHGMAFWAYSPAAGGFFTDHTGTASRWSSDNFIGKLYSSLYSSSAVRSSVATVRNAAEKHGIDGHSAALRWTAYHGALDGDFGDALAFSVSKIEQLHKTLDALEAGPLPAELANTITAVYATVAGSEPAYHF